MPNPDKLVDLSFKGIGEYWAAPLATGARRAAARAADERISGLAFHTAPAAVKPPGGSARPSAPEVRTAYEDAGGGAWVPKGREAQGSKQRSVWRCASAVQGWRHNACCAAFPVARRPLRAMRHIYRHQGMCVSHADVARAQEPCMGSRGCWGSPQRFTCFCPRDAGPAAACCPPWAPYSNVTCARCSMRARPPRGCCVGLPAPRARVPLLTYRCSSATL